MARFVTQEKNERLRRNEKKKETKQKSPFITDSRRGEKLEAREKGAK